MKKNGVTLTKSIATRHAEVFLAAIEKAGYYAGLYANPDYLGRFFDASLLQKYDLWLAHYMDNPDLSSPSRSCGIWQHSSTGSVSGISGHVDLDVAYKDYPAIIRAAGKNRLAPLDGWVETEKGWYWYEGGRAVTNCWRKVTGASCYQLLAEGNRGVGGCVLVLSRPWREDAHGDAADPGEGVLSEFGSGDGRTGRGVYYDG